ncbi:DUF2380 domain-containing protein [Paracoccus aestuariivivens]|uniref:DUF2380 domain-containing protein n=1 Tax=Paracoccus aestuariivivens TaxID=1820333 RepID=A0A6L6J9R2_9RHOB|nr:DUF2380 domain-containing protein [Paracoccus aestuariivivens]
MLPIKLLDTSHETKDQEQDHIRRLDMMADVLASELSGEILGRDAVASACPRETTACLVGMLRDKGAERGLFIIVQKTSTLILQVFASVIDVGSEKLVNHKELNFRGDNDEAYRRAALFLARQLRDDG